MLFGGFAQFIVTWLIRVTGTPLAPVFTDPARTLVLHAGDMEAVLPQLTFPWTGDPVGDHSQS